MEKELIDGIEAVENDNGTVYEVSYLLLPSLASEQIPATATSFKEQLSSLGAIIISYEDPVLIDLSYPMTKAVQTVRHKVNTGYFGWIKFEMASRVIESLKKAVDANPDVLRYLIVKTVRENTLLQGKMMLKKEDKVKREEEEPVDAPEVLKEIIPEELDKSIDELVIA